MAAPYDLFPNTTKLLSLTMKQKSSASLPPVTESPPANDDVAALSINELRRWQPNCRGRLAFRFYDDKTHGIRNKKGFLALR